MTSVVELSVVSWRRMLVSPSVQLTLYSLMMPLTSSMEGGLQSKNMWVELRAEPVEFSGWLPGATKIKVKKVVGV